MHWAIQARHMALLAGSQCLRHALHGYALPPQGHSRRSRVDARNRGYATLPSGWLPGQLHQQQLPPCTSACCAAGRAPCSVRGRRRHQGTRAVQPSGPLQRSWAVHDSDRCSFCAAAHSTNNNMCTTSGVGGRSSSSSSARQLHSVLGYHFQRDQLLHQACDRSSAAAQLKCAQLAYLGDAALWMLFSEHVFMAYPGEDPVSGKWGAHLSSALSRASCATAARAWGLDSCVLTADRDSPAHQRTERHVLGECLEGVVAAVLLDSKGSYSTLRAVFGDWVAATVAQLRAREGLPASSPSCCQTFASSNGCTGCSENSIGSNSNDGVDCTVDDVQDYKMHWLDGATSSHSFMVGSQHGDCGNLDSSKDSTCSQSSTTSSRHIDSMSSSGNSTSASSLSFSTTSQVHGSATAACLAAHLHACILRATGHDFSNMLLLLRCSQLVLHVLGGQSTTCEPQSDAAAAAHAAGAASEGAAIWNTWPWHQPTASQQSHHPKTPAKQPQQLSLEAEPAMEPQQLSLEAERLRFLGFAVMKLAAAQHTWDAAQQLRRAWDAPSGRHVAWRHLTDQASHMMTVRHRCYMALQLGLDPSPWCEPGSPFMWAPWKTQKQLMSSALQLLVAGLYLDAGMEEAQALCHALLAQTPGARQRKESGGPYGYSLEWANRDHHKLKQQLARAAAAC